MGHSRSTVLWCMMRETPVSRKEWQMGKRIKVVRDVEQRGRSTTIVTTMYNKKQRVIEGADGSYVIYKNDLFDWIRVKGVCIDIDE